MTTAVLISGQLRTFKICYPTQKWQIFRHYEPDIHFFVSCCDDEQAQNSSLLLADYENVHVERYQDPTDLPEIPKEKGFWAPYANATTHDKLMLQHWGNKKVWDFFNSDDRGDEFDTIIRMRPDLWIHRFEKPVFKWQELANKPNSIVTGDVRSLDRNTVFAPWWGKFGGINDRLAIMGREAAETYFNLYGGIEGLLKDGCPFHPETLLAAWLRMCGVIVHNTLMATFSTDRMDGSRRWAQQEQIMDDLAEIWITKA